MHRGTLFAKRRANPAIYDAIEKGRAAGIEDMANKLFDDGLAGNTTALRLRVRSRQNHLLAHIPLYSHSCPKPSQSCRPSVATFKILQHRPGVLGRQIGLRTHVHQDGVPLVGSELRTRTRIVALRAVDRPKLRSFAKQPPLLGLGLISPAGLSNGPRHQRDQGQYDYHSLHRLAPAAASEPDRKLG